MDKNEAGYHDHYQSTQRTRPGAEQPARPSFDTISREGLGTEAGNPTSGAGDPSEATRHDEGNRFTWNDKGSITEVSVAAMIRLRCRFLALDDVIQLYHDFDVRFKDDLLGWASNMHGYLLEVSEAVWQVISERTPTVAHHLDQKGWLYSAANKLEYLFYNTWSAESLKQFNANEPRSGSAIPLQGAPFPPDLGPSPSNLGPAVYSENIVDVAHRSPWDRHNRTSDGNEDDGGRSGGELVFGPRDQEKAEKQRRFVRHALVNPLTVAMGNWEEEGNRDIENMKRILWGM